MGPATRCALSAPVIRDLKVPVLQRPKNVTVKMNTQWVLREWWLNVVAEADPHFVGLHRFHHEDPIRHYPVDPHVTRYR
jgi:hypothetical protein